MLSNVQPAKAAVGQIWSVGSRTGACLAEDVLVRAVPSSAEAAYALPRVGAVVRPDGAQTGFVGAGYQKTYVHTTPISPAAPGGVGPHPAREPKPV